MDDVIVRDIVEEETTLPAEEITVNSASSTTLVVPLILAVMREFGVGVVEVSDHDEPVRNKEPRDAIKLDDGGSCILCAGRLDSPSHGDKSQIGENHSAPLSFSE